MWNQQWIVILHDFISDHRELGAEIERLRENLKPKVAALHKLEG